MIARRSGENPILNLRQRRQSVDNHLTTHHLPCSVDEQSHLDLNQVARNGQRRR